MNKKIYFSLLFNKRQSKFGVLSPLYLFIVRRRAHEHEKWHGLFACVLYHFYKIAQQYSTANRQSQCYKIYLPSDPDQIDRDSGSTREEMCIAESPEMYKQIRETITLLGFIGYKRGLSVGHRCYLRYSYKWYSGTMPHSIGYRSRTFNPVSAS